MSSRVRTAAWIGWGAVALLAVLVSLASLRYLSFDPRVVGPELRQNLLDHPILFFTHAIVAAFALLAGVWQFLPATRRTRWHRWAGRFYVACVAVASISGFLIATTTAIGPAAGVGFMILAVLWFVATAIAWRKARTGNYAAHRVWMIRSYALTAAAITLRIILPVGIGLGASFATSYIVAAWGCWIVNLAIAEWIIRTRFADPRSAAPLRPRSA